jgi:uncharacterized protein (DUF1697 family)
LTKDEDSIEYRHTMEKYVALLRGINVSGKNKIRMADLTALFEELGATEIKTYLQSGNVVFKAKSTCNSQVIEKAILDKLGLEVPVLLLSSDHLERIFQENPFLLKDAKNPEQCYVTFLWEKPTTQLIKGLEVPQNESGRFSVSRQCIYIRCPDGYGRTKINNQFFENKLKTVATTRNWKTVSALRELD